MDSAPDDPASRLYAFVFSFAKWHADDHVLARVIQYEFKNTCPASAPEDRRDPQRVRDDDAREPRARRRGAFQVPQIPGTALAVLSLCIDLARWYHPDPDRTSDDVGTLCADLALRMVKAEAA